MGAGSLNQRWRMTPSTSGSNPSWPHPWLRRSIRLQLDTQRRGFHRQHQAAIDSSRRMLLAMRNSGGIEEPAALLRQMAETGPNAPEQHRTSFVVPRQKVQLCHGQARAQAGEGVQLRGQPQLHIRQGHSTRPDRELEPARRRRRLGGHSPLGRRLQRGRYRWSKARRIQGWESCSRWRRCEGLATSIWIP